MLARLGRELSAIELPEHVLNYESTNLPPDKSVLNYLPKDTSYAHRFYVAPDEFGISANIILMGADRTSIHWMASNQLRLWRCTELEHASIVQIRLQLFKIAARFKVSVRRIHIELCGLSPSKGFSPKSIIDSGPRLSGRRQLNPKQSTNCHKVGSSTEPTPGAIWSWLELRIDFGLR